jgi:hypothetical protein
MWMQDFKVPRKDNGVIQWTDDLKGMLVTCIAFLLPFLGSDASNEWVLASALEVAFCTYGFRGEELKNLIRGYQRCGTLVAWRTNHRSHFCSISPPPAALVAWHLSPDMCMHTSSRWCKVVLCRTRLLMSYMPSTCRSVQ